ncbi:MAG: H-type lectin domain-containing protein, partial [Magnetococcales bacterium]|nr:H-type lectin domain-containing protein [Magnetococcales bacterium]
FSLTLVVVLTGILVARGGLPVREGDTPGSWRAWLAGGEDPALWKTRLNALEEERRLREEAAKEQLAALDARIRQLESRLAVLPEPQRLESGAVLARQDDKEWHLANLFTRVREFRQRVEFSQSFAVPPRVTLGVMGMDLGPDRIHFQASAFEIDTRGFTLLLITRAEERPRELQLEWMAFGR